MKLEINDWQFNIDSELIDFIKHEYQTKVIAPPRENIDRALQLTAKAETKVVIFGQDPYPTSGVATGLAFSSNSQLPPSLRNLFKELESDLGIVRTDPNLEDWAKQGILLLNTSLTVEVGNPGSHSGIGWMDVTKQVIEQLNVQQRPIVYVLLGAHAQKLAKYIDDDNIILQYTHPSPLSAYRGFWGCKMFSAINNSLEQLGASPINF